ncbi:MAG: hypothetical protein U0K95_06455, partial [Eubacterium sp.]|nr:hypothetical protein [Eubacterium sp.]
NTVEAQPSAILLDKSLGIKNLCLLEPFAVGTKAAFDDICDMIRGGVDLSPLVTQEFQLDQIFDAMEAHGDVEKAQKVAISYL